MVECTIPLIEAGRNNHAPTCRADAASTANTSSRRSGSRTLPTASLRWACAKSSVRLTEGVVRRGGLHMRLLISHPPNHTTASIGNSWWTTWLRPPGAGRTGGEWAPRRLVGGEGLGDVCIRKTARLGWYVDTRMQTCWACRLVLGRHTWQLPAYQKYIGKQEVWGEKKSCGQKIHPGLGHEKCWSIGYQDYWFLGLVNRATWLLENGAHIIHYIHASQNLWIGISSGQGPQRIWHGPTEKPHGIFRNLLGCYIPVSPIHGRTTTRFLYFYTI